MSNYGASYYSYYESYANQSGHAREMDLQQRQSNPLEELEKRRSPSATFARFDPPRCAVSTRLRIIGIVEEWINGNEAAQSSLFWLHGGAGVGKSALAQSLSEKYQEKKQLAASFFFYRSDPSRNNGEYLIPTLVLHLADTVEGIAALVEDRIRENPTLLTESSQIQVQELLVVPLLTIKSRGALLTHPLLVIIDGLDECYDREAQCELLRVIATTIRCVPYPLRFLLTSRPEAHMTNIFNNDFDFDALTVHRYNLSDDPDADMDIRKFLEEEFAEIRQVHRLGRHLPRDWPNPKAITSLVERSSGHFIFASTVIRYIRSPKHRPDNRLEVILRLRPPQEREQPCVQIDALYALIFADVGNCSQLEKICLVLGVLYFRCQEVGLFGLVPVYITIEDLLEMKAGNVVVLLDPILSLVAIDGDEVHILHKSLFDYLLDSTRGGHLPFNLARVHELAATYILKQMIMKDMAIIDDFRDFAFHCQSARLNDALKDYLPSMEVPCPKSVAIPPETFPSWDDNLNKSLRSSLWYFCRTLSREDLDSTGQIYEQYMAQWIRYLHAATPKPTQPQIGAAVAIMDYFKRIFKLTLPNFLAGDKADSLKRELDNLLTMWKPGNFTPIDAGIDSVKRLAHIKQEHSVFSAYAEASSSGVTDAIASSLVFGDYFIHSYNFGIGDVESFLLLRTYSRHGNTCYQGVFIHSPDIIQRALDYLKRAEQFFLYNNSSHDWIDVDMDTVMAVHNEETDEDISNTSNNSGLNVL